MERVPTVADLRARRLELTRDALRELLVEDDLDRFRVVVESLTDEFDVVEIALAAVKLAHDANSTGDDEEEIPDVVAKPDRPAPSRRDGSRDGHRDGPRERGRPAAGGMTRLFIGAGREAGIRPQDLVGAIAGETRLSGRDIGSIDIAPRFSLVEVPDDAADEVIATLRGSTIRGKRATVRRERDQGGTGAAEGRRR
jgi:ATP-dependent RNA helicase DeaD